MGKGRAPCCDKSKVKRGPWSPDEDLKLISFIQKHGHGNWRSLPKQAGLLRCGKSCRLRWINYLRPDVKRGNFSAEEEDTIIKLHQSLGNKWSKIASHLPGRTDNEIKNIWHTHLKKRLIKNSETNNVYADESSASSCSSDSVSPEKLVDREGSITEKSCSQESSPKELLNSEDHLQTGSLFEYIEAHGETSHIFQEVDKLVMLEIPFDSSTDLWSLLDGLESSQESSDSHEENNPRSMAEEADEEEIKKWFKYLENELGLEEEGGDNEQHKPRTGEAEKSSLLKSYELMID